MHSGSREIAGLEEVDGEVEDCGNTFNERLFWNAQGGASEVAQLA